MNVFMRCVREFAIWTQYPKDRLRWLFWKKTTLDAASFQIRGRTHKYFIHPYNRTWKNERAIEIPIVWEYVRKTDPHTVLEIGNVLSHYFDIRHCVVDKWEKCRYYGNVVNHDLLSWEPKQQYKLIVSISTVEHIGWDEEPRNPDAVVEAFTKIKCLLVPGGTAIISVPIGQNPALDQRLRTGDLPIAEAFFLKRITRFNEWAEIDQRTALMCAYGHPFPAANAVAFLLLGRNHDSLVQS